MKNSINLIKVNQQKEQLFSLIADDVPLTILSELIKEKELSIYDLDDNTNSVAQYRYALQKLIANNIIQSRKEKRKCYYSLSPTYKDRIKSLVSCYLSFDRKNILKVLQNFDGWAFRGKSALFHYVPFLSLITSRYMITVRSIKEIKKLKQLIPEIESFFDIKIQPTYFRTSTQYIHKLNSYPVLRPEIIFSDLLQSDDARVRLATIFLLPYVQPDLFYSQIRLDKRIYLTTVYLLFTLQEYLQEENQERKRVFFQVWFSNIDLLDHKMSFDRFLKVFPKRKASDTFFRSLQKTLKKEDGSYTKWDQAADLVPDRLVKFHPEAFGELTLIKA